MLKASSQRMGKALENHMYIGIGTLVIIVVLVLLFR